MAWPTARIAFGTFSFAASAPYPNSRISSALPTGAARTPWKALTYSPA